MAGSVRDVTAHLLDDGQPDAMSQAEPLDVQQIVPAVTDVPASNAGLSARPAGKLTALCIDSCSHEQHVKACS